MLYGLLHDVHHVRHEGGPHVFYVPIGEGLVGYNFVEEYGDG